MSSHDGSIKVLLAALAGNVAIAIAKTVAAVITGSAAMLSEAIHSAVDTGNEILLLYGMRRAAGRPIRRTRSAMGCSCISGCLSSRC